MSVFHGRLVWMSAAGAFLPGRRSSKAEEAGKVPKRAKSS